MEVIPKKKKKRGNFNASPVSTEEAAHFLRLIILLQWPPLVEVVDTWDLPTVLVERYNAAGGEGNALCGIFPEIHRAWASVDNSLFLWRFDKW